MRPINGLRTPGARGFCAGGTRGGRSASAALAPRWAMGDGGLGVANALEPWPRQLDRKLDRNSTG